MALPPEKINELKQIIHSQISQMDIQNQIRGVVSKMVPDKAGISNGVNEADVMNQLRQQGVVDEIMRHLQMNGNQNGKPATHFTDGTNHLNNPLAKKANIDPTRRYLYLLVNGGRAFLEHLEDPEALPGQKVSAYFTLHIYFRNQRFRSRPVPCAVEPEFDEGFLLELHKESAGEAGKIIDITSMLSVSDPIHLVLIKTDAVGDTTLVSSHFLEWRPLLTSKQGLIRLSLEVLGTGNESRVPVGVLDLQLEMFPKSAQSIEENAVRAQLEMEKSRQADKERLFLVYAKQWWKEYLQIRESHQDRLVKLFAQDENGVKRPVSSYVKPLRAGRLLDTPREAARFVSLMHHEKVQALGGGGRVEQWTSTHAFLCRNRGDCEDHTILLCSLLLGFGLNAYVCVGTKLKGSVHTWVMTISADGAITFWESLNGHRFLHVPINPNAPPLDKLSRPNYPYKTVGCVFNHQSFYANSQPSDSVEVCHFDLANEAHWKSMSSDAIISVCGAGACPTWPIPPPLSPSTLDPILLSNDLEQQLRVLVMEHRRDQGLTTAWDDQLSYILTPALAAYETERLTGITAGNEEFQDAVRLSVPEGQTFKGYPIQFSHRNARKAFVTCLRSPVCDEIINCRGDQVKLGVRVKVYAYPESACATWIMFACKYKSIV
ncbi:centrosomal protein of 76 kDa-like [Biomphalaria glabrata]|uniref:Centrosomal protein of 76 kDa n=2 Tax=Biomphalaria glabrata TaxID=6526 RepID=A0A9W3AZ26_BIOGL|nr:centrosomal protein of 76 kDa-like [Biomphalaria glabrata]